MSESSIATGPPGNRSVSSSHVTEMETPAVSARRVFSAHYWATLLLLMALVPILRAVGLPVRFTWTDYFVSYWLALTTQSAFAACVLYVVGFPYAETLAPVFRRIGKQKTRLLFLFPLATFMIWLNGPALGLMLFVDAIALLELVDRSMEGGAASTKMFFDIFIPAVYLFAALILVFAYNDVIVLRQYDGSWEFVLNRADAFILGGHTISPWAHAVLSRRLQLIPWLQIVYFAMFAQVGAAIVILAWRDGRSMALKFAGAVVTAYYVGLFLFYWLPAFGPAAICQDHFSVLPSGIAVYEFQKISLESIRQLRLFGSKDSIGQDYFIGFPSMHLVQPLIVLWFLRRWKGMVIALIAYDVLMVAAILLLEQHYVVDLIAAVPVAAMAIAISGIDIRLGRSSSRSLSSRHDW